MTPNQRSMPISSAAPAQILRFEWLQAKLHWLFLIYAVPAVFFLSIAMPPFQVADELAHMLRADQIAFGSLVSHRFGGRVHADLVTFGEMYQPMWFHRDVKQTVDLARRAGSIAWSRQKKIENFQNTAQYGPFLYAPQAAGMLIAKWAKPSFARSLLLARLLNGMAACALGFFALLNCRRGRALMFATLLLPMTLSEFGSASQDALMIGLSLLTIAVASRILSEGRPAGLGEFALFAATLVATTLARPSQIALSLLSPIFVAQHDPRWRGKAAIAVISLAVIIAWFVLLRSLLPPVPADLSVSAQFHYLLSNPLALPTVMLQSFASQGWFLAGSVIGRLGWLDTPLPDWFLELGCLGLLLALIAPGNRGSALLPGLVGAATVLALLTATCFALYLSWTPVAYATINGLQGRYILPVLPLLGWAIPAYGPRLECALMPAWAFVVAFPIVTLATLPPTIMERYYGSWEVMTAAVKALYLP